MNKLDIWTATIITLTAVIILLVVVFNSINNDTIDCLISSDDNMEKLCFIRSE